MGWLKTLHNQKKNISMVGAIPAYYNFMNWGNTNDEEAGLPKVWKVNGEINIPYLDSLNGKVSSVYQLPKYEGKALIFIGMGQSLNDQVKYLKKLSDRYILISTNSSCEYLLNNGITPHYVILLDGRPGTWTMDLGDKAKDITAIFGPCAEPEAIKAWSGKIMIVPLGVKDYSLNRKIRRRWGKPLPAGGNAINSAFSIFSILTDAKIMLFVGNDLSFKDTYYGDGRKCNNDDSIYFFSKDIHGEMVRTLIPLYEYKVWLETVMAQTINEYFYINCSGGILGVDVDGELMSFCKQMPLKKAIKEVNEAFEIEEKDLDFKLKYLYDQFYDHDLGNQQRGRGIWKYVHANYDVVKGIDVGCGRANGVQYAREHGLDVYGCDISSAAVKCWKERGVSDYCKVAPADDMPYEDNAFDFVLCSEVMEHIPEENTLKTLKEILRIGSDKFLFTIALTPELIPVAGLVQSHINLHPVEWWLNIFEEAGFRLAGIATNEKQEDLSILAVKDESKYKDGMDDFFKKDVTKGTIPVVGFNSDIPGTVTEDL